MRTDEVAHDHDVIRNNKLSDTAHIICFPLWLIFLFFVSFQNKRNAIIFGDIADRANANNMLTRNSSLDESLDNMKPLKPRKSVTFKDC